MPEEALVTQVPCPGCGTELAPSLLACPACRRLVHGDALKVLAADAEAQTAAGDTTGALVSWRTALALLPADSRQHAVVKEKIAQVSDARAATSNATKPAAREPSWKKRLGPLGVGGMVAFLLTKAKLLLLGLTKMGTLVSMLVSFGVYWTAWGWKFAAGLIVSIYVHEMGHVAALRRLGIAAEAPMFIPGLGAIVRLKQYPASPREDALVGLAGPTWGLGAALAAYALAHLTRAPSLFAIAQTGALINLFNLLPIWQLDGGRGFRALTKVERVMLAAVAGIMWFVTRQGMVGLVAIVAAVQSFRGTAKTPDPRTVMRYATLVVALAALASIDVRTP